MTRSWPKLLKTLLLITAVMAILLVGGIYAASEGLTLRAESARLALVPEFFPFTIQIRYVELASLKVRQGAPSVEAPEPEEGKALNDLLSSLALPFPVNLSSLDLGVIEYFDSSGALVAVLACRHPSLFP
jgi:hypothetical protein